MDDFRLLCKDIKEFSQEIKRFEDYLEKDVEPPDCDEAIKKFRLNAGETLSSLTARYSDIQSQISAASTAMHSSRKLLENLEQVLQKRELQLCKYGFKPTKRALPHFPELQISKKSRESDGNKVDVILQKVSQKTNPSMHQNVSGISGPSAREEALISKYTPGKEKRLNPIRPSESRSDSSVLLSKYNGDAGEKTNVISQNTHDGNSGLSQPDTKTVGKNIELDRLARYLILPKQTEVESEQTTSSDKSSDIQKRIEHYSVLPSRQKDAPFSMNSKSSEVYPVQNIGDLLSKYPMQRVNAYKVQSSLPVTVKKDSPPKIITPMPATPKESSVSMLVDVQEDSFSGGFVSNPFRHSIAPQDDDLERTVNIPTDFRKPEPVGSSNVISTPKKLRSIIEEIKTPIRPNCHESAKPATDYDNLRGVSAELFKKSESNIEQKPVTGEVDKQEMSKVANNENVANVNSSATNIPVTRPALSSIFAKYSQKYNS